MNRLHSLKFPKAEIPEKKKQVPYLYIDADEDHVSLQYLMQKATLQGEAMEERTTMSR